MQLEHIMQMKGVEIPPDEEGADRPVPHQNFDSSQIEMRKYTPYETYHLGGDGDDNDDVPLQLLTAEEKVEEL